MAHRHRLRLCGVLYPCQLYVLPLLSLLPPKSQNLGRSSRFSSMLLFNCKSSLWVQCGNRPLNGRPLFLRLFWAFISWAAFSLPQSLSNLRLYAYKFVSKMLFNHCSMYPLRKSVFCKLAKSTENVASEGISAALSQPQSFLSVLLELRYSISIFVVGKSYTAFAVKP